MTMGAAVAESAQERRGGHHLPALDGVRAIAILAVLANHTFSPIGRAGYLGVDLFFVLSGYLISTILLRERERTGSVSLPRFYARRALRLYPALIVACVAALLLPSSLGYGSLTAGLRGVGITGAYLQDLALVFEWPGGGGPLGHTWSLAVEEHFYLLWPPILALALARRWWGVLYGVAATGVVWSAVVAVVWFHPHPDPPSAVYFRPDLRAGELLLGVLLALTLHLRPFRPPAWLGWAGVAAYGTALAVSPAPNHHAAFLFGIPLTCLAGVAMVADLVAAPTRLLSRVLGWRPLVLLGLISYGLYLYHPMVFAVFGHETNLSRSEQAPIAIALSVAAAAVSYRYIEQPFLRLKRRLRTADVVELS